MKKIGLYSCNAEYYYGSVVYETEDGQEIVVTAVFNEVQIDEFKWEDKIVVGPVTKYLHQHALGIHKH